MEADRELALAAAVRKAVPETAPAVGTTLSDLALGYRLGRTAAESILIARDEAAASLPEKVRPKDIPALLDGVASAAIDGLDSTEREPTEEERAAAVLDATGAALLGLRQDAGLAELLLVPAAGDALSAMATHGTGFDAAGFGDGFFQGMEAVLAARGIEVPTELRYRFGEACVGAVSPKKAKSADSSK